jgi:DNA polymerase-3 subunit gamma/tau
LAAQYSEGADPMAVLRDLAEITHWISVVKITPDAAEDPTIAPEERSRGKALAEALPIRVPSRLWQMLLKAIEETASAPNAMMAAEMAIIRMTHVADLPSPEELVRKLSGSTPPPSPGPGGGNTAQTASDAPASASTLVSKPTNGGGTHSRLAAAPVAEAEAALSRFPTFEHVVELIRANRDVRLLVEVETCLRLAAYRPGRIEFTPTPDAPADLAQRLGARLHLWTGNRWAVTLVNGSEVETIAEVRDAKENALKRDALEHPMMQAVLAQFPAARIVAIRTPQDIAADAVAEALPEVEDEWDPFEDG